MNNEETVNELTEESCEKQVVIPEFYRDLKQDEKDRGIWHYVFRTNGDRKPIKTPDNLPHKLDFNWTDMFPDCNGHVEVEIGSGKGNFMTDYAERHPDIFIMGSEWDYTWAAFAHERMKKRGVLGNAAMLRGDVFYFLRDAVKDNTVDAFHMISRTRGPRKDTTRTGCCAPTSWPKSHACSSPASGFSTGAPTTRNTTRSRSKPSTPSPPAKSSSATRPNPPKGSRLDSNASTRRKAVPSTGALSNFSNNLGSGPILTYSDIQIFIV